MCILRWRYFYIIFYACLSLAILGPLLLPGSVLTLDIRHGPIVDLNSHIYGTSQLIWSALRTPLYPLLWLINEVVPFWVWQKIIFFLVFFLSGVGAYRLFPTKGLGSYFAGILYTLNPFTYVRFLAGQLVVLEFYALIPFAIKAFIDLLKDANKKNAIKVALFTTLVGMMYGHGFYILFIVFITILIVWMTQRRNKTAITSNLKYVCISAIVFLFINTYWLVPVLTTPENIVEQIGKQDLIVFAPASTSDLGLGIDVASMHGFWRRGYLYIQDILPCWWLLMGFLAYLAISGYISGVRDIKQRWLVISFGALWLVGYILAVGITHPLTQPIINWLYKYMPFFQAFRDSHKFVILLCLSYAYLGALQAEDWAAKLKQDRKKLIRTGIIALLVLTLLVPFGYSFTMFGFHGQLGVTDYPEDWYEAKALISQDKEDFFVLFLPWHEFMDYHWLPNVDKRWGSSAHSFFDKPVIQGDNIEIGGYIYTQSANPISDYVSFLINKRDEIDNMGELLAPLNIKYVILVHEADYREYDALYRQEDLSIVLDRPKLTIFRNGHSTARAYAVDSVVSVDNFNEFLKLSQTQDIMKHLYVIGGEQSTDSSGDMEILDHEQKSTIRYQISGTQRKYIIFTIPQSINNNYWEYENNKEVSKNLMMMPVFTSSEEEGEIIYTRFHRIYLPSYIISGLSLALLIVGFCFSFKKKQTAS